MSDLAFSPNAVSGIALNLIGLKDEVERLRIALDNETDRADRAEQQRDAVQDRVIQLAQRLTELHSGVLQSLDGMREMLKTQNARIAEVGAVADRSAQFLTALNERVDFLSGQMSV